ncbi:hypothetical protein [Aquimarina rhabdastrellae]
MKNIIKNKRHNALIILGLVCIGNVFAQHSYKLQEKFTVNKDATLNLTTSYTNVIFETWNKNTIQVEAYVDSESLNDEQAKYLEDTWQIDAVGNSREVTIRSIAKSNPRWSENVTQINVQNAKEFEALNPKIKELLAPIMKGIDNNPMPSALKENLASLNFNANEYQKNEEKYVAQWEKQIKEKFGNNANSVVKNWSNQLTKDVKSIPNVSQQDLSGEGQWRGQFSREMEIWASQFINQMAANDGNITITYTTRSENKNTTSNRIIKVKMPKDALMRLNVRHGKVALPEYANNVKASLSHTQLSANVVDGAQTDIRVSYSPIVIQEWKQGRLVANYVKNCRIGNANTIQVNADSSNIYIEELNEKGAIAGSFGNIIIANMSKSFTALDVILENSDIKIAAPKTAFNFTYSGGMSRVKLPSSLEVKARKSFGGEVISGFQTSRNTEKAIIINAKYSDIELQ